MTHLDHDDTVDRLLKQAHEVASDGRALDALDVVLASSVHDHRLDRYVVELRYQAFTELPRVGGRPQWPATFEDPFPDVDQIPKVAALDLSGEVLGGALTHHGCCRVDGLVSVDDAEALRDQIDQVFDARDRALAGESRDDDDRWYFPFSPGQTKAQGFGSDGFVRTVDSPAMLREVADVFARTGVRDAVHQYLGERPAMIANKWILRRSLTGKIGPDYHQDGAFLGEGIRTIDCWIALSDCGPGTGRPAIDLVARRFTEIIDSPEAAFPWSLREEDLHRAAPDAPVLSPVFAAGDALFFDEMLPHRTTMGLDLSVRYALESWFVAPSSYPAKHTPVVL